MGVLTMEKFSKRVLASHVYGRLDAIQHEHRFDPRDGWAQVRGLGEEKNRAYGEYDALLRLVDVFGLDRVEARPEEHAPSPRVDREEPIVVDHGYDPSDGMVHVRDSREIGTLALCGRRGQTTVSSAWGYWGPTGRGYDEVCKACVQVERQRQRGAR